MDSKALQRLLPLRRTLPYYHEALGATRGEKTFTQSGNVLPNLIRPHDLMQHQKSELPPNAPLRQTSYKA